MQLVYLSPMPWAGFVQRPHQFVTWFHRRTGSRVLWVDPYPTRLPIWQDLRRLRADHRLAPPLAQPDWLEIARPHGLPVEPLPVIGHLNHHLWQGLIKRIMRFASRDTTLIGIGKPSLLALGLLGQLDGMASLYDAMDDFPAFYSGLSRAAMARRERQLVNTVTWLTVSSTALRTRWQAIRPDVRLVPNGVDADTLPAPRNPSVSAACRTFGYVGTLGAWFDWDWVIALAQARPDARIKLIGPLFAPAERTLASNIELHPQCTHAEALNAMREFDVGLIPFRRTMLTRSVDPIKYYEYRALGLPVISTRFGEMALRDGERGTFLSDDTQALARQVDAALHYRPDTEEITRFRHEHCWEAHFSQIGIVP